MCLILSFSFKSNAMIFLLERKKNDLLNLLKYDILFIDTQNKPLHLLLFYLTDHLLNNPSWKVI